MNILRKPTLSPEQSFQLHDWSKILMGLDDSWLSAPNSVILKTDVLERALVETKKHKENKFMLDHHYLLQHIKTLWDETRQHRKQPGK